MHNCLCVQMENYGTKELLRHEKTCEVNNEFPQPFCSLFSAFVESTRRSGSSPSFYLYFTLFTLRVQKQNLKKLEKKPQSVYSSTQRNPTEMFSY